ncbi:NAD(P)/FAD-dependent oxidoreductase [Alkalibacillus silvisoli]|uniref:15-cis-phytoene desaturase n=1 Tax=Alkalibacillus silvisoli TaxID=392823 RepID=A0ABP3JEC2_9BACI
MDQYDVIIIGGGLAGISCGIELAQNNYKVLILEKSPHMGGRTASWDDHGMLVETGSHRVIGYYKHLPKLLKKAGVDINDIVSWEDKLDVLSPKHENVTTFGVAPLFGPFTLIRAMLGNNQSFSAKAKLSLAPFFKAGLNEYKKDPKRLDQMSILEFARQNGVHKDAIHLFIEALCNGIFFTPPERFSAYVFFGILAPAPSRFYKMRIGGFLGGMSEVMFNSLVYHFENLGGKIMLNSEVQRLITEEERVEGVSLNESNILAKHVVLATELGAAKQIINQSQIDLINFYSMLKLPTAAAVSVQLELTEPALEHDRTTFAPGTALASFSEQSRSTFTHVPGRISIIIGPSDRYIDYKDDSLLQLVYEESEKIGLNINGKVTDYRVVKHPEEFYSVAPGHDLLRPVQKTVVPGLTLAGDYTKQPFFSTMEGAVFSGELASKNVKKELNI